MKRKYIFGILILATAVVAGSALVAGNSAAAAISAQSTVPGSNPSDSANWSGYVAATGTFTGVTGTWTIPTPTVTTSTVTSRTAADATWVGIGGVTSRNLIQAGTQAMVDPNGNVTYEAWYETLPQSETVVPLSVNPGDSMTVTITETSQGEWQITLVDTTTGAQYTTSVAYSSTLATAEWIEEVPSAGRHNAISLDNFGSVNFTNAYATVNGSQESMAAAGAEPVTMVNDVDETLASPSSIGPDGASFTVNRSAASSSTYPNQTVGYQYGNGGGSVGFAVGSPFPWFRISFGGQGFGRTVRNVMRDMNGPNGGYGTISESYRIMEW